MALGTPVAGAAAYSASGGTSVSPAYPSGILATDVVLLFLGQKPSTANGGTATTPAGWTLREELLAAGGYGTTLGADTGNTNLRVYSWDSPVAGQTGTRSVTIGTNNVSWAFIVRIPTGGGALSYGSADGQRTTTPTSPMSIALTNGATATDFEAGDKAIWAMCIPTDVQTPSQFSAQSVTATGATFATATELNEPDSGTGNDIGGYSAYAHVNSGSSTAAPTVTTNLAGTLTNVRGPVVLLRVREAPVTQTLTPNLYTNNQTFFSPTVSIEQFLTPDLYTNTQVFYSPDVTQAGGVQNLDPALYTNTQTFYSATVAASNTLTPALYTNAQTFYQPTVAASNTLTPALYTNNQIFYSATVTQGTTLLPDLYTNQQTFYSATVTTGAVTLLPGLYTNAQTFYAPTVDRGTVTLLPDLYTNAQTFYSPTVSIVGATQFITFDDYVDSGYVDPPGYVTWVAGFQAGNTFFPAVVSQPVSDLGGGGPSKGWSVERQRLELSLEQRSAVETLAKSKNKTVKRIAKRLDRYITAQLDIDAELAEIARLEVEFAKLETLHNNRVQLDNDLREAARIMQQFVQDEQDAITLLMLTDDFDARCVIEATVGPLNLASLVGS